MRKILETGLKHPEWKVGQIVYWNSGISTPAGFIIDIVKVEGAFGTEIMALIKGEDQSEECLCLEMIFKLETRIFKQEQLIIDEQMHLANLVNKMRSLAETANKHPKVVKYNEQQAKIAAGVAKIHKKFTFLANR